METPLVRKLGIREGSKVALVSPPAGLEAIAGPLDVAVLFVSERAELERRLPALVAALDRAGGLWVAYPKKSSRVTSDLSFAEVQRLGLAAGLVDNKSAAIDDVWTAVRFVYRLRDR